MSYERTSSPRRAERGALLVFFMLMMMPLLFITALAFDGFLFLTAHLQQDNNAEFTAEAAALALWVNPPSEVESSSVDYGMSYAEEAASRIVAMNSRYLATVTNESAVISGSSLRVGCYSSNTNQFYPFASNNPAEASICVSPFFPSTCVELGVVSEARLIPQLSTVLGFSDHLMKSRAVAYRLSDGGIMIARGVPCAAVPISTLTPIPEETWTPAPGLTPTPSPTPLDTPAAPEPTAI